MGPGRCGTTLIIRLLQKMGYDTGGCHEIFREKPIEIRKQEFVWPRVIKGTGTLCVNLNRWVKDNNWNVEVVILCVRKLESNIASMIRKKRSRGAYKGLTDEELEERIRQEVPAGYKQARANIKEGEYRYIEIEFPRSARDVEYCYNALHEAIPDLDKEKFITAWTDIVDQKLIRHG